MFIKKLSITNFMGYYGRNSLDFDGKQTIGIIGNNESGKSTLLKAITYAIFGDSESLNSETREINMISDGSDTMIVEEEIELESGEVLSITRGRTQKNTPIVEVAGFSGKPSELSKLILDKVGISFNDFADLSYFVQGDIHGFMRGSKRDYFTRWAKRLNIWDKYEDCAKSYIAEHGKRLESLHTELLTLSRDMIDIEELRNEIIEFEGEKNELLQEKIADEDKIECFEKQIVDHRLDLSDLMNELQSKTVAIETEYRFKSVQLQNEFNLDLLSLKNNCDNDISKRINGIKDALMEVKNKVNIAFLNHTYASQDVRHLIAQKDTLYNKYNELVKSNCPVFGSHCERLDKNNSIAKDKCEKELDSITKLIDSKNLDLSELQQKKDLCKAEYDKLISSTSEKEKEIKRDGVKELNDKLMELKRKFEFEMSKLSRMEQSINDLKASYLDPITIIEYQIDSLTSIINSDKKSLICINDDISKKDMAIGCLLEKEKDQVRKTERINELKQEISKNEQDLSRYSVIKRAVGKEGVPLGIMSAELSNLETRCNWVLEQLEHQKMIQFSPCRELAEWEKICRECGSDKFAKGKCAKCGQDRTHKLRHEPSVNIISSGFSRPFELESGGSKVLISFAVRLACSLFLSSMTGIKVKMIILDEIFAMLDHENRHKLMRLVIGKLKDVFGIRQQFVVSHHNDIVETIKDLVFVEKINGKKYARFI